MPNSATFVALVDSAMKCLAIASVGALDKNHFFADFAFVIVSWVVNVFDAIMNRVVSAFRSFTVSARCVPSMFDTKCTFKSVLNGFNACVTINGPKSDPPMPTLTMSVILLPV